MAAEKTSWPPVIDMLNFPEELERLAAASAGLGCFRVINHGIPAAMMAEIKAAVMSLSELPTETKLRNTDIILGSGYTSPSPIQPLMESFGIYDAASRADVLAFCSTLDASSGHRDIISGYASKAHSLSTELASRVAECLGLVGYSFREWSCHMRFNHYFFTKESVGSSALQVHTDSSFLTLLQDDDESGGGLEIFDSSGHFVAISPMPDTFLVIVGDVAKAWSNGRLHNVKHRVLCKGAETRVTIVFYSLAPKGGKIEPQPELIDSEHPRIYETFTFDDYRKLRLSSGLRSGETLSAHQANNNSTITVLSKE